MAEQKRYTVHRSMHGDGKDYEAGDTRLMAEADAAELVKLGALSLEGEEPAAREPAMRHTFGTEPSKLNTEGYTVATGDGVSLNRDTPAAKPVRRAKAEA
ncbi:hypothetical protein [Sphingomonas abaci]|uniref:Uncharacterized protein n=1 Tax=Sphingomonas abaci TaxID=237611 RepID=A0A7W7AKY7_9SPHN|nr:hypothetical protein [Sphingomonas abaci]MBB4618966.1 hypothetical protein [Sphingomonas abaci]